jgi:hypothetical protein
LLQEHVFFEDTENEITISSTRIVVEDKVFSSGHLVSYEMTVEDVGRPTNSLLFSIGFVILGTALNNRSLAIAGGIVLLLTLILWAFSYLRRDKGLLLSFSSGEEFILNERSYYLPAIQRAMNELLIFRG